MLEFSSIAFGVLIMCNKILLGKYYHTSNVEQAMKDYFDGMPFEPYNQQYTRFWLTTGLDALS